jgi:hypothetical protein
VNPAHIEFRARKGLSGIVVVAVTAAGVVGLALRHGGFDVASRTSLGALVAWALALALAAGLWSPWNAPREARVIGGTLLLLLAATALSLAWAPGAENALLETDRVALYLAVFALVAGSVPRGWVRPVGDGLAAGLVCVALASLAGRLFPALRPAEPVQLVPALGTRLSWPIGYWNGLAILVALAVPLVLERATGDSPRAPLALMAVPVVSAVVVLSASRSAALVAAAASIVLLALSRRRRRLVAALLASAGSAAVTYAILRARPVLLDAPLRHGAAAEGRSAALLLVLVAVATPLLFVALQRLVAAIPAPRWAALAAALVGIAAIVATDPVRRARTFAQAPDLHASSDPAYVQQHLLAGSGSGRWQMWQAALHELAAHPLLGGGAGSFAAWWTRHRPFPLASAYAHSLYLQTAAELGLAGILVLATVVGAVAWGIRRRLAAMDEDTRAAAIPLVALVAGFAVAAAVDWMWEIPVVALVAVVALALVVGRASAAEEPARRPLRRAVRFGGAAALLVVALAQTLPFLADARLRASDDDLRRGALGPAYRAALDARTLAPWESSPRLELALLDEQLGRLDDAQAAIDAAIARDPQDWRLPLVAARIALERGDTATWAAERAQALKLDRYALTERSSP